MSVGEGLSQTDVRELLGYRCLAPPKCVLSPERQSGYTDEWYVAKDIFISGESLSERLRQTILSNTDHMVENL